MKKLLHAAFFLTTLSFSLQSHAQVVINEYSASNLSTVMDNYGNYEDWIELYNNGASAVNLSGYHLSDKASNPLKYAIPAGTTIAAGGRLRFWCSKKNITVGANYHTNFTLTQCAPDQIVFSDAGGVILDSLTMVRTQLDNSRGRTPDGAATWGMYLNPTPNAANGTSDPDYAATPVFSIPAGFYTSTQTVSLSCATANTEIRYTINGAIPTTASTLYTTPITVSATTLIKARAFSTNASSSPSFVETNTYFINAVHTINVVSLGSNNFSNLFGNTMPDIMSSIEYFGNDEQLKFEGYGEVNPHGNDSWAFPQKGVDYVMKDEEGYSDAAHYKVFTAKNRNKFQRLIFKAAASDNYPGNGFLPSCHMRDALVQTLAQKHDLEMDERSYEPCQVYINGQYWGLYETREKVNDPDFTDHYYHQDKNNIDVLSYWGGLNIEYGSDTGWVNLYNYITSNPMTVPANYDHVKHFLNLTSVIDYDIFNTYIVDSDWINWNTQWWRGRDTSGSKLKWRYSLWDEDNVLDLGQNYSGWNTTNWNADPCDLQSQFGGAGPNMGHMVILTELLTNQTFKDAYINRYADLMNSTLCCDTMTAHLNWFLGIVTPEMPAQVARWGGSLATWNANVATMQSFITNRCAFIDSALIGCYNLTGPYDVTLNVDPPLAGSIQVNTITPIAYPWTGTYFGPVNCGFKAFANTGYVFDHWSLNNNVLTPGVNVDSVTTNLTADDSLVAHFIFNTLPTYNVTVDVTPPASGDVKVQNTTVTAFPWTNTFTSGDLINMQALPHPGYTFAYWQLQNHLVNPNSTTDLVNFVLFTWDTVIAHFTNDVGVEDPTFTAEINIFPTITPGKVNLACTLTENGDVNVDVFNIVGERISHNEMIGAGAGGHMATLDLSEHAQGPGTYFVQFTGPGLTKVQKVVYLPH